jgi:hypothetical protein
VKYDCGLIGDEFCVARDKEHHYLIKFSLVDGKWGIGNKRAVILVKRRGKRVTLTMGYYKDAPILKMRISDRLLKQLMDYVSSQ